MSQKYADIIIDISHEGVDKTFEYKIPDELLDAVQTGSVVNVPFGRWNKVQKGYVIGVKDSAEYDPEKLKDIIEIDEKAIEVEASLIRLAAWMKEAYSCTMITALRTVMPVKEKVSARKPAIDIMESVPEFTPIAELNEQQQAVVDKFSEDYISGRRDRYLLHGITGSGKTEVYIQLAKKVTEEGRAVIVLIPEIALTFQTVDVLYQSKQKRLLLCAELSAMSWTQRICPKKIKKSAKNKVIFSVNTIILFSMGIITA